MDDAGAKLGSDRDYRKETQSDEFGRSCSDPNLVPGAFIFSGTTANATYPSIAFSALVSATGDKQSVYASRWLNAEPAPQLAQGSKLILTRKEHGSAARSLCA